MALRLRLRLAASLPRSVAVRDGALAQRRAHGRRRARARPHTDHGGRDGRPRTPLPGLGVRSGRQFRHRSVPGRPRRHLRQRRRRDHRTLPRRRADPAVAPRRQGSPAQCRQPGLLHGRTGLRTGRRGHLVVLGVRQGRGEQPGVLHRCDRAHQAPDRPGPCRDVRERRARSTCRLRPYGPGGRAALERARRANTLKPIAEQIQTCSDRNQQDLRSPTSTPAPYGAARAAAPCLRRYGQTAAAERLSPPCGAPGGHGGASIRNPRFTLLTYGGNSAFLCCIKFENGRLWRIPQ